MFSANKETFINDFIEFAGGTNIAADSQSGIYSREKVIEQNPDVIIITTMGISGKEEANNWKRYKNVNAVKNNKIFIIDSYNICSPTPVTFRDTLKELVKIIHPEIDTASME